MKTRVCIIGAGPSGLAVLYQFAGESGSPDIECFEKQSDWGGMWNYTWETGTDQYGETCHGSMYKYLWTNAPKELFEFPNYTYEEHFGKLLPSFAPRAAIRHYLEGRYTKSVNKDLRKLVHFDTPVHRVQYREKTDDFLVTVNDNKAGLTYSKEFSHVIIASGIFCTPYKPAFSGIESFEGLVLHSHDFRDAKFYSGMRILCIGSSYSAEDIAIQCLKFGAKQIICTWKNQPMNYKFPEGIEERPLVESFDKKTAHFRDGSTAEVDVVIFCTGYQYSQPYLEDGLRLKERISLYPANLYKGIIWTKGGNNKLLYVGAQNQFFTFVMFEQQAAWIKRYIMGSMKVDTKDKAKVEKDIKAWRDRVGTVLTPNDGIDFQADYVLDLMQMTGYKMEVDLTRVYLKQWIKNRQDNIATYKDQTCPSTVTGKTTPPLKSKWLTIKDDSMTYYLTSAESGM